MENITFIAIISTIALGILVVGGCLCYSGLRLLEYCCDFFSRPNCICTFICSCCCDHEREHGDFKKVKELEENSVTDGNEESFGQFTCRICLEEMETGEDLERALCRHKFHKRCLERWLLEDNRCPICNGRARLIDVSETPLKLFNEYIP